MYPGLKKFLRELFYDSSTKIIVCDNPVTIAEPSERDKIITENHASAIGGHKGITKTYKRIPQLFLVRYEIGNTKVYTGMPKLPTKIISPRKNTTTHGAYRHSGYRVR